MIIVLSNEPEAILYPFKTTTHFTLNDIAIVYHKLGRFIEALDYFEKFLEIKRALLGTDDHLFIAIGLTNMASVYFSL